MSGGQDSTGPPGEDSEGVSSGTTEDDGIVVVLNPKGDSDSTGSQNKDSSQIIGEDPDEDEDDDEE